MDALDELHLAGKQPQEAALSLISLTYGATLGARPCCAPWRMPTPPLQASSARGSHLGPAWV